MLLNFRSVESVSWIVNKTPMMELFRSMALFAFLVAVTRGVWPWDEKAWRLKMKYLIADKQANSN